MRHRRIAGTVVGLALVFASVASTATAAPEIGSPLMGSFCSSGAPIVGTGATFATNAHNGVFIPAYAAQCGKGSVTYTGTGSGAGKAAALNRTTAWGGSDEPLTADEWASDIADSAGLQGRVSPLHHIPIATGAVTVSYNLTSCGIGQEQLSLRSPVISAIFLGAITKWNDTLLTVENANLASCNKSIKLAVRADGSGTTYAFKDYLSKRNPEWNAYKQPALNTAWPAQDAGLNNPLRGTGNGGVAAVVKANDGAIGYVEYSSAKSNALTWAKVDGSTGVYNSPAQGAQANCDEAATGAATPPTTLSPGWDAVSMTDTPNPTAYAICTFTYALVYNNLKTAFGGTLSAAQAQTLADYLGLALSDGVQATLNTKGYAKLPIHVVTVARAGVASLVYA